MKKLSARFKYAFFDFDGVIVDSEPIRLNTYKNLFTEIYGIDVEIDKHLMVGKSENYNLLDLLKSNHLDTSHQTISNLKITRSKMLISEAKKGFPEIGSVIRIIEGLKSMNIPMAIVTNSSYDYIDAALDGINIDRSCFFIVTANDVSSPKPDPEGYLKTLRALDCKSKDVLAFEDSLSGISAAKSAGLETVAVHSTFDKLLLEANFHLEIEQKDHKLMEIVSLFGDLNA